MEFNKVGGPGQIPNGGAKPETKGDADGNKPHEGDLTGRRLQLGPDTLEASALPGLRPATPQQPSLSLARSDSSSSSDSPMSHALQEPGEELAQRLDEIRETMARLEKDDTLPPRRQGALLGALQRQLEDAEDALANADGRAAPVRGARSDWVKVLESSRSSGGGRLLRLMMESEPAAGGRAFRRHAPHPAPDTRVPFIGADHPMSRALQAYHQCMDDILCPQLHQEGRLAAQHLERALEGVAQLLDGEESVLAADERILLSRLQSVLQSELQTLDRVRRASDPDSPAWTLRSALDIARAGNSDSQLMAAMELARTAEIYEASYQLGRPVL